jgi:hypothetical protein
MKDASKQLEMAEFAMNEDLSIGEFIDRKTLRLVRHYSHPMQRVWAALTDREQVSIWYLPCTQLEARAGGAYTFGTDGKTWRGVITDFDPPRLIDFGGGLRFELFETESGCRLVLTLKRPPSGWSPMALAGLNGWLGRLHRLVSGVSNDDAERWASNEFPWEGLFLAYERLLQHAVSDGAKVIYRVHFEPNQSGLTTEAITQMDGLVAMLKNEPRRRVCIDGFGDDPCSIEESLSLSRARVEAVTQYLRDAGLASERIEIGFALGNYHFLVPRDTEAGRAFNRRIEIRPIY